MSRSKRTSHHQLKSDRYVTWIERLKRLPNTLKRSLANWLRHREKRRIRWHLLPLLILLCLYSCVTVVTVHAMASESDFLHEIRSEHLELMSQGQQLYQLGQFEAAATVWKQAAIAYENRGQRVNQALALSYGALADRQLGNWSEALEAIATSLQLLRYGSEETQRKMPSREAAILAQVLNTQGNLQFSRGQTETALSTWQVAAEIYHDVGDPMGTIATEMNQAKALQILGLYRRSQRTLEQVNDRLQQQPNSVVKAQALINLGNVLRLVGSLEQSQEVLTESLAIAEMLKSPTDIQTALLNLGNTARASGDRSSALDWYQKVEDAADCDEKTTRCWLPLQAKLNQLSLLVETDIIDTDQWSGLLERFVQLQTALIDLPPSQMAIYGQISLAKNAIAIAEKSQADNLKLNHPRISNLHQLHSLAAELLATAIQGAKRLENVRAHSYGLGTLANLYEQTGQFVEAKQLNSEALALAQAIDAPDIAYQWQWQLGRVLTKQDPVDIDAAIAFYTEAFKTLNSVKRDLIAMNPDVQFSFQESVEPIYRELVGLLLVPAKKPGVLEAAQNQENIGQALQVIDSLYLTELENYFREACLFAKPQQIDRIDPNAAVIYPIILPDRLEIIVSLPGHPLQHSTIFETRETVENTARQMRNSLRKTSFLQERLPLAQTLYDWLIRPVARDLANHQIKTLVFVLDGAFRNLPMAALHDGDRYLIENYAIALSSSLQLLQSQALPPSKFQALTAGISKASQGFKPLPGVELELSKIAAAIPAEILLNEMFTSDRLKTLITQTSFPVIHLATHGQFSSNLEQTFLLAWDDKIKVKDLQTILSDRQTQRTPIELLVLSACQTAEGDKRATLGLAGTALRSGARSTLATLWAVNDESTAAFMAEFYQNLAQANITKAEAQRLGQLKLLHDPNYQHPFYWAPFVLVGNWL